MFIALKFMEYQIQTNVYIILFFAVDNKDYTCSLSQQLTVLYDKDGSKQYNKIMIKKMVKTFYIGNME